MRVGILEREQPYLERADTLRHRFEKDL